MADLISLKSCYPLVLLKSGVWRVWIWGSPELSCCCSGEHEGGRDWTGLCFGDSSAGGCLVTLASLGFYIPTKILGLMPAQSPTLALKSSQPPFSKSSETNALWLANGPLGKQTFGQGLWVVSLARTTAGCECTRFWSGDT